ncbi:MAG: family 1 glycosylhydrolase [Chloroflexota bacterium]|nr:family 1 glycosylhydrolase [Chloroflexota bacterium]
MFPSNTIPHNPVPTRGSSSTALRDTPPSHTTLPEMWGGIECTVNRVGDRYFDQTVRTGHQERISDLARFAELGISAIRYPVLWERTAPDGLERADWRWPDERLGALRDLGVRPIVGLVHHGSGPRDTDLLDPRFPERLAAYARAVAERYPWVEDWTPVNEPLTTARFSARYGYWYPHKHDDVSFARALLNQCRAVVLAMEAIRSVNSAARLIQTDDLGKTFSTPELAYQAEWENERRWLTWDLLTGSLTVNGPLWGWMRRLDIPDADLRWFLEHPCPPDIVGINHYLSSARFLDDRLERYPTEEVGTNGRHRYVDVLAARVLPEGAPGPGDFLYEAWQRYHLPVAVTEAHNGCTREEQMRWLADVWHGAGQARAAGADVRAVTAWSLLGAFDWDQMVTRDEGHYEPGVFDLRAPEPRPTALAHMVRALATERQHAHPVLAEPGWWRQPDRLYHPPDALTPETSPEGSARTSQKLQPILIVGDEGAPREALTAACQQRYLAHRVLHPQDPALLNEDTIDGFLRALTPWAVIDLRGLAGGCDPTHHARMPGASAPCVMADALAAQCAAHGVAYLRWTTGDQPHAPAGALIICTEPHLVSAGRPGSARPASTARDALHDALDLLVDGEVGVWCVPLSCPANLRGGHGPG